MGVKDKERARGTLASGGGKGGCRVDEEAKLRGEEVGEGRAGDAWAVAGRTEEQVRPGSQACWVHGVGVPQSLSVPERSLPSGCRGLKGQVRWERMA